MVLTCGRADCREEPEYRVGEPKRWLRSLDRGLVVGVARRWNRDVYVDSSEEGTVLG